MRRDQFDALIRRLEDSSRRHPRAFVARIVGMVLLTYGYLALVLLGSLGLCLAIIALIVSLPNAATIKLGLVGLILFGGIFWAVLRGLWVRLEPPNGLPVTREQSPGLFALLEEIRTALDCRPFHQVLLVPEHNAAVIQVPRLGVFGWHRNYLLLGLPLMHSLAPDEFKAVLAHEFAHSSRGHGRFGNWLYRVRRSWDRIFEQLARQRTRGSFVLSWFIKWLWPHFNGHAFVLARANEYEADACSVRLAGADAAATALLRLPVDASLLTEKFWPQIYAQANSTRVPPQAVMLLQASAIRTGAETEDAARWLRQAFLIETNNSDTHPCLKDRLRAMNRLPAAVARGEFPSPPPKPAHTAAEVYLGPFAETAARQLSEEWRNAVSTQWAARHEHTGKLHQELVELEKSDAATADAQKLWSKATRLIELHDDLAASVVIDQLLALDSSHVGANFVRGRQLLAKDDARGVEFIETAMAVDPATTQDGCNLLYGYYTRTGQREKLRPLEDRVDKFREVAALAQQERAKITAKDIFISAELQPGQVEELRKLLGTEPDIGSAAVARKQVVHFPKSGCYLIGLRIKTSIWKLRSSGANRKLVHRVVQQVRLPGHFLVFVEEQNLKSLGKKVFAVPGAKIYERARPG